MRVKVEFEHNENFIIGTKAIVTTYNLLSKPTKQSYLCAAYNIHDCVWVRIDNGEFCDLKTQEVINRTYKRALNKKIDQLKADIQLLESVKFIGKH